MDADGDLVTGATGLDSEVSKDGGMFADATSEATEIATSSGVYYLDLTAIEMNADTVAVIVKTTSIGAKTTTIVMYPEEAGDIRVNVTAYGGTAGTFSSGRPEVNTTHVGGTVQTAGDIMADTNDIQTRLPAALVLGRMDVSVGAMATGVLTATAIAADAITDAKVAADVTIASVTGAVGSVTGNVGGNVTGSVGSIAAGGIAATSFAANAINAAALATDAVTEIQSGLATAAALSTVAGYIDTEVAAILQNTGTTIPAQIAALNNLSAAQVNAEVVDALNVDTYAEPGQGAPAATASLVAKLGYLYKAWRNRTTQTGDEYSLYADDGTTKDQKATVADNGTTFTRSEVGTGA